MGTVTQLRDRIRKIDVAFEAAEAIEATKSALITKQKDQMLHGLKADGSRIGKYKSNAYAKKKFSMNSLAGFGNMDWRLTAELYRNIDVKVFRSSYFVISDDFKAKKLIEEHGDPFDLMAANKREYTEEAVRPQFVKQIKEKMAL